MDNCFYRAAVFGRLKVLQKLWEWTNDKLTTEEINNKLLLVTNDKGRTLFHRAADWSELELLEKVWDWANEKLTKD